MEEEHKEHKKETKKEKVNSLETYLPMLGLLVLGFALGYIVFAYQGEMKTTDNCILSGNETPINLEALKVDVKNYLTRNFLANSGVNASVRIDSIVENGSFYTLDTSILVDGEVMQQSAVHTTKDGKLLILGSVLNLSQDLPVATATPTPEPAKVEKMEKAKVEIFVMSYCPYGLQMQKAMAPVYNLLKDKADIELKYVYYTMHGEIEVVENTRQYCIGKEYDNTTMWRYVSCFAADGNYSRCYANVTINESKIESCINATHAELGIDPTKTPYPLFDADNTKYGVGGSPTLVINGVQVNVQRNPEAIKQAICDAFLTAPSECNTTLSNTSASAGLGYAEGSGTEAQCG